MEKKYSFINNITGWAVLLFSTIVYVLTIESTASFWDCGEFIASATKLQVGHPPGAPLWSMKARMFAVLAEVFTGGTEYIAFAVNVFSALCSSFSILFLFWSITALAKKITLKTSELTSAHTWGIMFSGLVGSLAYTFSDSFWFSAAEAEVYAASSLYTAAVFWLALKWDANAEKSNADRYLILIAYLMGLSIGVHILNLLVIPAIVYIYYFNKNKGTVRGFFITGIVGVLILGVVQQVVISYSVEFATKFELYFVNERGLGFDSGMWIYFVLIGVFLVGGIILTKKKGFPQLQKAFLCVMVILIGYSSFAMIVIRSAANPPMDENNPENILTLLPYLNREQYGDRPLMFGPTFESIQDSKKPYSDGSPVYYRPNKTKAGYRTKIKVENRKDNWVVVQESNLYSLLKRGDVIRTINGENLNPQSSNQRIDLVELGPFHDEGKLEVEFERKGLTIKKEINLTQYFIADDRKRSIPSYNEKTCMYFPRMYSTQGRHIKAYKVWSDYDSEPERDSKGRVLTVKKPVGGGRTDKVALRKPSQVENFRFFANYQFNYMYWRYFMWNFTGRQNDIQGHGSALPGDAVLKGNWLSGVPFVDNAHLGDQSTLPLSIKENPGRNEYYFLPLILGIIGMIYHFVKHRKDAWIVLLLFLMTGFAIILYLNQTPFQPRERDYAYAGSFYAFAIWIGLGVQALYSYMLGTNKTEDDITQEKGKKGIEAKLLSMGIYEISITALAFVIIGFFATFILDGSETFGLSCVYIGLIILGYALISAFLGKLISKNKGKAAFALLLTGFVPVIMAVEGWDDHDRSDKYTARDFAKNYLDSCEKNAIIFTNGDNDTFPLWYVQEVEGYRTDVRVINLSLLNTDWYIDQAKRAAYDGKPVPFSLTQDQYRRGTRDYVFVKEEWSNAYHDLKKVMEFVKSDYPSTKIPVTSGQTMDYLPTDKFSIPVDSATVIENGTVPNEFADVIPNRMEWKIKKGAVLKSKLMILDLLAHNNWKRPVYFAITVGNDHYMNLEDYFQLEGLAYRVTPIKHKNKEGTGWINIEKMYDNLVNKFQWGNMEKEGVYMGEQVQRMSTNYRSNFARLARLLCEKGDTVRALKTLDRCMEIMPTNKIRVDFFSVYLADAYYKAKGIKKANQLMKILIDKYILELEWYINQEDKIALKLVGEIDRSLTYLKNLKYFMDRNIELMKFREDKGLEEALKLRQSIDDFETLNGSAIELFMNKVQKATRKQRK
tara:strand:- start:4152 stop:7844 length:3693 start_codon:yes stop_codon:yes gene_type:complete